MAYEMNMGPYPARTAQSSAGWPYNMGADQATVFDAGAPYWDMPEAFKVYKFVGDTFTLDIPEGGTSSTYQWYKNNVSMGASYQTRVLTLSSLVTTNGGSYHCVATNILGSAKTYPVALYVRPAAVGSTGWSWNRGPYYARAHESGTDGYLNNIGASTLDLFGAGAPYWDAPDVLATWAYEGSTFIVDIAEYGVDSTYQWYKDGVSLGASYQNRVLNIASTVSADGGVYTCTASNVSGSRSTTPVALYVRPWPSVSSYSSNRGPYMKRKSSLFFSLNIGPLAGQRDVAPSSGSNVVVLPPQWMF